MLLKGFVKQITLSVDIGPNSTHASIILFAKTPDVLNTFAESEFYSNEAIDELIESIPNTLGSRTFIDRALLAADAQLFTEEGGDRPQFPNTLVLLTDGKTNEASIPYSGIIPSLKVKKLLSVILVCSVHPRTIRMRKK